MTTTGPYGSIEDTMQIARTAAPVREQAVKVLRHAILTGRFMPGQRLVERTVGELLGTSRTTVREAFRALEAEGLIKVLPGRGPVVATVTAEEARDLYQVREAVEGLAARLFAKQASASAVLELEEAFQQLELAGQRGDVAEVLTAKNRFYDVLFGRCGNTVLYRVALSIHARVARFRLTSLAQPGRIPVSIQEVKAILDAIRARDAARAERASVAHVCSAAAVALQQIRSTEASTE